MTAQHAPHTPMWRKVLSLPKTRLGWWAVGLSATFVVVFIINQALFMSGAVRWEGMILPLLYAIAPLGCGLAGGVVGLIAVIRQHERSWLVWLTMLPLLFVLFLVIGEFLIPPFD